MDDDAQKREFVADALGRIGIFLVLVCTYFLSLPKILEELGDSIIRLVIPFVICAAAGAVLWLMRRAPIARDALGLVLCECLLFAVLIITFAAWPDVYMVIRLSRSTLVNYVFILTIARMLCPVRVALWPVRTAQSNHSTSVFLGTLALAPLAMFAAATRADWRSDALCAIAAWLAVVHVPRLIWVLAELHDDLRKAKAAASLESKFTPDEMNLLTTLAATQGPIRRELLEFAADTGKSFPVLSVVVDNTAQFAKKEQA